MKLDLWRLEKTGVSIIGRLSVNGMLECWTLENPDHLNSELGPQHICVPCGTYPVEMYNSPKFGFPVPIISDVPSRSFIEIHIGNQAKDTEGCILVGKNRGTDCISGSQLAFKALIPKIQDALAAGETVEITVQEAG